MKKKFFEDDLLYVVDGELMNQLIKLLSALDVIDAGPEKQKVLGYFIKAIIQVSNHPTGEAKDELDYIEVNDNLSRSQTLRRKKDKFMKEAK